MTYPIPTSNHNEALAGDTLYSAFLNYEWRQIVVPFVISGMAQIAATIDDEAERQAFEVRYGALIEDFYNEDVMDGTPVGAIVWFPGLSADVPSKWLKCDGASLLRTAYPALFNILRSVYPFTATHFNLPDLSERFLYGSSLDAQVGATGGATTHTLTIDEIPAHNHSVATRVNALGSAASAATGNTANSSINTGNAGGGGAHNNMPPYARGYWIIKALP